MAEPPAQSVPDSAATQLSAPPQHGLAREILGSTDVARTIDRIAHQIIEKLAGSTDAVLMGIPTRGVPLARRLAGRIAAFDGGNLAVGVLDTTLYRDDLRHGGMRPLAETVEPEGGIDDTVVILVDDVLFRGRTVRAALDAVHELGRPRAVRLAVLVDRGHRELPIRADYVGKNLPTSLEATVHVLLAEVDGRDAVLVEEPTTQAPAMQGAPMQAAPMQAEPMQGAPMQAAQ